MYRPLAQLAEALLHTTHVSAPRMYPGMQPSHWSEFRLRVLWPVGQGVHDRSAAAWQSANIFSSLKQFLHRAHLFSLANAYVPGYSAVLHGVHTSLPAPVTMLPAVQVSHL